MYCEYPTYWNGSSCVTFPRGGYQDAPLATSTTGVWPSPNCGGYYYNGTGTVSSTTGASSVVYGTASEVQPYYCKFGYEPQNRVRSANASTGLPAGYALMDSPILGCHKLTYTDHNTNSYKCSECQVGWILNLAQDTCTKVSLGSSSEAERNKYGCAKCADATCTYCAACHEGYMMGCSSTVATDTFAKRECCKTHNSASSAKKYSYDIQMNNTEIPYNVVI